MSGTGNTVFSESAWRAASSFGYVQNPLDSSIAYAFGGKSMYRYALYAALYRIDLLANSVQYIAGNTSDPFEGNLTAPEGRSDTHRTTCCGFMEDLFREAQQVICGVTIFPGMMVFSTS
jgi:hypothetical protein